MKNTGNILGAFFIGAGIGAIIGILLAPDKGSATREKLVKGAKDLAGNFKNKIAEFGESPLDLEHRNRQEFYNQAFTEEGTYPGS